MDRIVRSPGKAGFVGIVKRKAGVKLRDDVSWRLEEEAGKKGVKREERQFRRTNGEESYGTSYPSGPMSHNTLMPRHVVSLTCIAHFLTTDPRTLLGAQSPL